MKTKAFMFAAGLLTTIYLSIAILLFLFKNYSHIMCALVMSIVVAAILYIGIEIVFYSIERYEQRKFNKNQQV